MAGKKQLPPVVVESGAPEGSNVWAGESGSLLEVLRANRRVIQAHLDSETTLARDLASLSRQNHALSERIAELEAAEAAGVKQAGGLRVVRDGEWDADAI